jgi:isopenicillin N synthase-like dioxygenase
MAERDVPLIDLEGWFTGDASERQRVLEEVRDACEKVGFLAIKNHHFPEDVFKQTWSLSREFFDLPLADKTEVPMTEEYPYGYEYKEILSYSIDDKNVAAARDWKETFQVCVNMPAGEIRWPSKPKAFDETLIAYYRNMEKLGGQLMRIFALALDLPEEWFEDKINKNQSALRVLNYPHQDHLPDVGQVRASAHTDYGTLTILAADDAPGGLQVQNLDGSWQDVKLAPGVFVVNLGDLMQRWSNDKWRSTMHRVVNPSRDVVEAGADTRRQSIAFFMNPNPDTLVEVILCKDGEQPKYPPILAEEHLMSKHNAAAKGKQ